MYNILIRFSFISSSDLDKIKLFHVSQLAKCYSENVVDNTNKLTNSKMSIFNTSKFVKFLLISFVAVVCLMTATRQRISQTVQVDDTDDERAFLLQVN